MDIKQLRNFLAVINARSFTGAARSLHLAQPALGLQIRNLERELGTQLLIRHARGVEPTEAGTLLARHAEMLLRQFERARQDLIDYEAAPRGRVVLGLTNSVAQDLIATLVERCRQKYPDIHLAIIGGRGRALIEMVATELLDLALTFYPTEDGHIRSIPLVSEDLMFVRGPGRSKLPRQIDIDAALDAVLILPSRPHIVRELVEEAAAARGKETKLYCEVESVTVIKELVRRGLAASLLPLGAVQQEVDDGNIRVQRIRRANLRRTLYLLHSGRRPPSKALGAVCTEVQTIVGELTRDRAFGWKLVGTQVPGTKT